MSKKLTASDAFLLAHSHVAQWEGGLCEHPSDPGGLTNHGISIVFLTDLAKSQQGKDFLDRIGIILPVTRNTILSLTAERARDILRYVFWEKSTVSSLPPLVSMCAYDIAVNAGTGRSAILLQKAINKLNAKKVIVKTAGNFGPLTHKHAAALSAAGRQEELANAMLAVREAWYHSLAEGKPSSAVFLKGWINRTRACLNLVQRTVREWEV